MPSARDIAKRVGHLSWTRACSVCGERFTQRRAGRPRVVCSDACRVVRQRDNRRRWATREPCPICRARHAVDEAGGGYRYCERTGWHFRPGEQLTLDT